MAKRKRVVYRVHYVGRAVSHWKWQVTMIRLDGMREIFSRWSTKARAVASAVEEARARWRISGELTQVVVMNKDGRISREMTYGKDPARRKG